MKIDKALMKDTSDPDYKKYARNVRQFEAEYGEDWDGTMIEYDNDFVSLPMYVYKAALEVNLRTVLQWLGKGDIKERVNAKLEDAGNAGLLCAATSYQQHCFVKLDLMSYLLLNGADVNILESFGASALSAICWDGSNPLKAVRLLLGWGAELFGDGHSQAARLLLSWGAELLDDGKQMTEERKLVLCDKISSNVALAKLMSSKFGGRRCEIVSTTNQGHQTNTRGDLVGKTCVVEEFITESDQCKVTIEFTNEVLLLGVENLKRRDRTPQEPGYYVECKNNRLIRRDFKSNEECQTFIASLSVDKGKLAEVDPDAENKAEQAAADLLAELGLGDLEGPNCDAPKKEKQPVAAGKKKKRGGKKKGRK